MRRYIENPWFSINLMKQFFITFALILAGLFFSIYALFVKDKSVFVFGLLLFYFSLMLFIWLLSLSPGTELEEEKKIRIFGLMIFAAIIGFICLAIGYPLLYFYFR